MLALPDVTHILDAGELDPGLKGIEIELILYPKDTHWEAPWDSEEERKSIQAERPWERRDWVNRAQRIREIRVPENMRDEDEPDAIVIDGDPEALYELEHRPDWITSISIWASNEWIDKREEWAEEALGNSSGA